MDITRHAVERIFDRTRMFAPDVLSVVSENGGISLGVSGGVEHILFYSYPDQRCKVAVVSEARTALITVCETDFARPLGINKVTAHRCRQAKKALSNYLFKKLAPANSVTSETYGTTIFVLVDRKIEYKRDGEQIKKEDARTLESAIHFLSPDLRKIFDTVEGAGEISAKVKYQLCFTDRGTGALLRRKYEIRHKKLRTHLEKTA